MALDKDGNEIVDPVVPPVVPDVTPPVEPPVVNPPVLPEPEPPKPQAEPTGNAYFDAIQDVMLEKGIAPQKYWEEVYANDGAISPESRAELVAALGEPQVKLMEKGIVGEMASLKASQQAEAQKVYDAVQLPGVADGKAAFNTLAVWSQTNLTPEERSEFNGMLSKGGVQAQLAVKALKEKYMADPNYSNAGSVVSGDGVPDAAGPELISRSTYVTELRKAENARDKAAVAKLHERAKHTMANAPAAWRP